MSDNQPAITGSKMDPTDNDYATPAELWRPLSKAVGGFDLDPCSGAESTPIAPDRYTKEDDGLVQPWHGVVFVNPPWSSNGDGSAKVDWLRKARNEVQKEPVEQIIMILPVDTSTHWFHQHVMASTAVCLCGPGRISFEGGNRNPSFNLLIAVFGPVEQDLIDTLDTFGVVLWGRSVYQPSRQQRLDNLGADK